MTQPKLDSLVIPILLPQLSSDRSASWQTIAGYLLALGAAGLLAVYTVWFNIFTDRGIVPKSINIVFMTTSGSIFLAGASRGVGHQIARILATQNLPVLALIRWRSLLEVIACRPIRSPGSKRGNGSG